VVAGGDRRLGGGATRSRLRRAHRHAVWPVAIFGWIVDVAAYRGSPRQWLYTLGLRFSLALTALLGVWALLVWLYTIYTGHKLAPG
jgi:hypothetical protein